MSNKVTRTFLGLRRRTVAMAIFGAALVLVLALLLAACGGTGGGLYGNGGGGATTTASTPATTGTTGGAGGAQVTLQNIQISPTTVTIKVSESVTWTNKDSFAHHLVGDKGEFDSGDMAAGATFSFAFKTAGTYAYHCSIHPEMKGTVVVQ